MKKQLLILFNFCCIFLFSQKQLTEKQIDSTLSTLHTSESQDVDYFESGFTELYYKSREIDYTKGKIESLLRLSAFYLNTKENPEKIKANLNEAERLAIDKNDYFYYCKARAIRAGSLANMSLYSKASSMLRDGSGLFGKIPDKNRKIYIKAYYYSRYINIYALQNKKDSVLFYAKEMYKTSLQLPDKVLQKPDFIVIAARVLTGIYIEKKQFKEAEYYLRIQEKYLKKLNNIFDVGMYHKLKANLFFTHYPYENNDLDSTLYHLQKAEKYVGISRNITVQAALCSEIADVYNKKNDNKNQLLYLSTFARLKDSLWHLQNSDIGDVDTNLIIPEFDQEAVDDYQMIGEKPSGTLYYLPAALFLLILLIIVAFGLRKKHFNDKIILSPKTEHISNKERFYINNNKIIELTSQALGNDKAFFFNFMKEFPDFGDKLTDINPSIKVSDIEFCAMLRLNLQMKQIAEIKRMSLPAVTAKKGRIRKKLNISTSENMYLWLCDL